MIRIALAALMALVYFPAAALAAGTVVDLSPLMENTVNTIFAIIGIFVVFVSRKLVTAFQDRTNIALDEQMKARIDDALAKALAYGRAIASDKLSGRVEVDLKSEILARAAEYALQAVPDTLRYFGVTEKRLMQMLEARLHMDLNGDGAVGSPASA